MKRLGGGGRRGGGGGKKKDGKRALGREEDEGRKTKGWRQEKKNGMKMSKGGRGGQESERGEEEGNRLDEWRGRKQKTELERERLRVHFVTDGHVTVSHPQST